MYIITKNFQQGSKSADYYLQGIQPGKYTWSKNKTDAYRFKTIDDAQQICNDYKVEVGKQESVSLKIKSL